MRFASFFFACLSLMAQRYTIRQEGSDWVRTDTGNIRIVNPRGELRVHSQGRLVVRGVSGEYINYILTQRVRAVNEAEAVRRLSVGGVTIDPPFLLSRASPNLISELIIDIPRQMKMVSLVSHYGPVEVRDLDGIVSTDTQAGDITMDGIQGAVLASSGGGRIHLGRMGSSVQCSTLADSILIESAGGSVNCQTAGGEIQVKQAGGLVWLSSGGGNIIVDRAAGSVEAHAVSGGIDVGQAGGTVIADTRGGSIRVGSANGVRAESGQGAVRLTGMSGPMNVSTAMGNILAELLSGMALQDSSLMAVSGDITVMIPSNFRVSVMATNEGGGVPHIVSDFSEVHGQPFAFSRGASMITGDINGGGPVLRVNTGRGVIFLKRIK